MCTVAYTLTPFKAAFYALLFYRQIFVKSPVAIQSLINSFRKLIFALNEYGVPFNEQSESGL